MSAKLWKGAAIGAASGLLGAVVMNLVPTIWSKFEPPKPENGPEAEGDDATVKTAERIAEPILKRPLSGEEKKVGGPIVHFAFGAAVGAIYGALAQAAPPVTTGCGTVYATAVWLLGDEFAVPQLGLAPPPSQTPPMGHFKYWLMHAVYGMTLDGSRRLIEKQLLD